MNKKFVICATAIATLMTAGCSTLSQDMSIANQLNALKANPAAAKYSKVTSRAEKAYYAGKNDMAQKLIDIVNKKVERGSTY